MPHYSKAQVMSLRLYPNTRHISNVIEEHGNSKLKETSQTWRAFTKSIDFIMHLINTSDYLVNCSNPVNLITQKLKYRFNGQYSYFYMQEISNTTGMVSNLSQISYYIDEWTLYQFDSDYNVNEWINSNKTLFTNMPIFQSNFKDLLNYKYKGYTLSNFDMDLIEAEYKDNENEDESDEIPGNEGEWS